MNALKKRVTGIGRVAGRVAAALVLAATIGGAAARPALADDDDRWEHGHHWREHERHEAHERWEHRGYYYNPYERGVYIYGPPPVVYEPAPPPAIQFVFPLDIH